jgi:hypothetical protein
MLSKILMLPFRFLGWITGVTRLRETEREWIEQNGEIPDGHYLKCGWFVGATGTIEEYRCELRRVGSTGTDLPFSY